MGAPPCMNCSSKNLGFTMEHILRLSEPMCTGNFHPEELDWDRTDLWIFISGICLDTAKKNMGYR